VVEAQVRLVLLLDILHGVRAYPHARLVGYLDRYLLLIIDHNRRLWLV